MMPRLTKRTVEGTSPSPDHEQFIWDDRLAGFGLRVYPNGRRIYVFQYRPKGSHRTRRAKIGEHGPMTAEQARGIAEDLYGEVREGRDPAGDIHAARNALTIAELCDRYLVDHADSRKKSKSVYEDRAMIKRFARPRLGSLKVHELCRSDVVSLDIAERIALHQSLRDTPYQANRVLALLSKMMNLAERWGLRPDGSNPSRHVEKFREQRRERFLAQRELVQLAEVLRQEELERITDAAIIAAIRLLLFTGARLSEIITLRWQHVDFANACLGLPDSKTGAKTIYLSPPALEVLTKLKRQESNPYVITGAKLGAHLVNLEKPWRRIRQKTTVRLWMQNEDMRISSLIAGLRQKLEREPSIVECQAAAEDAKIELPIGLLNVRLHDLRHSFASIAAAGGLSLPMIGALLGHTQYQTTKRYAHLLGDPLKQAADAVGRRIASAMKGKEAMVVVALAGETR